MPQPAVTASGTPHRKWLLSLLVVWLPLYGFGWLAERAAALLYAHFKKEFGLPVRR